MKRDPRNHRAEAIVLKTLDYGENDRIVTVFSREQGQISGIAKHARHSTRRFGGALDIFTRLEIHYGLRQRSGLVRIDFVDILDPFLDIRRSVTRILYATHLLDMVLHTTKPGEVMAPLFDLLCQQLSALAMGEPVRSFIPRFDLTLFALIGFAPNVDQCGRSGRKLRADEPLWLSLRSGFFCDPSMLEPAEATLKLSLETSKLLRSVARLPLDDATRIEFSPRALKEALHFADCYLKLHLGRSIRSDRILLQEIA